MRNLPQVIEWDGKNIQECSRDELLEAVQYLHEKLEQEQRLHKATREIHALAVERKGGIS